MKGLKIELVYDPDGRTLQSIFFIVFGMYWEVMVGGKKKRELPKKSLPSLSRIQDLLITINTVIYFFNHESSCMSMTV